MGILVEIVFYHTNIKLNNDTHHFLSLMKRQSLDKMKLLHLN